MSEDVLGIDHLGLTVSDLDASTRFFVEALGWKQLGAVPDYPAAFVSNGHATFTLWQQKDGEAAEFDRHANVGLHHTALKIATREGLDQLFDKVKAWPGVVVEFGPELLGPGPRIHFMIREPGGTRLEFCHTPG